MDIGWEPMIFVVLFVVWSLLSGQLRYVGASALIPCKILLKISVKHPSFLTHQMLSMVFRKASEMPMLRAETVTQTDTQDRVTRQSSIRDKFRFIQETDRRQKIQRGESREFSLDSLLVKLLQGEKCFYSSLNVIWMHY